MNRSSILASLTVAATVIALAPTRASAQSQGPGDGVFIDARLTALNLPGGEGLVGGLGGPARAAIGYRSGGFSVGVGPAFHRITIAQTACPLDPMTGMCANGSDTENSESVTALGAQFLGTFRFAAVADGRAEMYGIAGLTLATAFTSEERDPDPTPPPPDVDERGNSLAFGLTAGVGIRYYLSPHLSLGAELGEGYLNIPVDSSVISSTRASSFTTWGALVAGLVF